MMFYVYSLHLASGKQQCVNRVYDTAKEAIEHIRLCYNTDMSLDEAISEFAKKIGVDGSI